MTPGPKFTDEWQSTRQGEEQKLFCALGRARTEEGKNMVQLSPNRKANVRRAREVW